MRGAKKLTAISLVECVGFGLVLSTFTFTAALADEAEDARYHAQRDTNDLVDQEKLLLKQEEELNRTIDETKHNIQYLADSLDGQLAARSRIRHQIIVMRLKLLH